jgi:hypothetical protein
MTAALQAIVGRLQADGLQPHLVYDLSVVKFMTGQCDKLVALKLELPENDFDVLVSADLFCCYDRWHQAVCFRQDLAPLLRLSPTFHIASYDGQALKGCRDMHCASVHMRALWMSCMRHVSSVALTVMPSRKSGSWAAGPSSALT